MSFAANFDLKERVRDALSITDVVGRDLELRPQGRHFVARCPFHNDKRPSMTVNQDRQTWKCWVCDVGGDIFSFVMQREGVDFPTALRILADVAGIPYESYSGGQSKAAPGSPEDKATLFSAMKLVSEEYYRILESSDSEDARTARAYLAERGINEASRRRYRIGFSPDSWSHAVDLLRRNRLSEEVAVAAGVAIERRSGEGSYDRFRGRLMFPIHDLQDRPISMGGRIIPPIAERRSGDSEGPKYINGPETKLYRKSNELYGLPLSRDAIRIGGEVLVMEGYTDVIAAGQAGVETAVAVLGTALGEQHVKILRRFAQRVVLVLDGDAAGQKRADEVLEIFVRCNVDLRVMTLPEGNDPADFIASRGREAFEAMVAEAPDAFDHKLNRLTDGVDLTRDTHQATQAVETMLSVVSKSPEDGDLRSDQMIMRLSRTFGLPVERLTQRLAAMTRANRKRQARTRLPAERSFSADTSSMRVQQAKAGEDRSRADRFQSANDQGDPFAGRFEEPAGWRQQSGPATSGGPGARSGVSGMRSDASAALMPLSGLDRELVEAMFESPSVAAKAVEAIDPNWLESNTAKILLSAYQDLDLNGQELDTRSLMVLVENEQLKNLIVRIDQGLETKQAQIREKSTYAVTTPEQRYSAILCRYRERDMEEQKVRQIAKLETAALPEAEELALLREMFEAEQLRQGQKE